jgi:hypothetical protein
LEYVSEQLAKLVMAANNKAQIERTALKKQEA